MQDRTAIDFLLSLVADGTLVIDGAGQIWRHKIRNRGRSRATTPRRAENVGGKGYLRVTAQLPAGRLVQVMAHRLVFEAANGPIPDGMQVNHKDLVRTNNAPSNLELVDASGNIRHSYANGRNAPWSRGASEWRAGRPLVGADTVSAIRAERAAGDLLRVIAARHGLSTTHVCRLLRT